MMYRVKARIFYGLRPDVFIKGPFDTFTEARKVAESLAIQFDKHTFDVWTEMQPVSPNGIWVHYATIRGISPWGGR